MDDNVEKVVKELAINHHGILNFHGMAYIGSRSPLIEVPTVLVLQTSFIQMTGASLLSRLSCQAF